MSSQATDASSSGIGRRHGEGYSRYARVRAEAVRAPNYISDNAAPGMLCQLRRAEPRPYTPLPRDVIPHYVQPLDYEARPSSFVAHQAVMDLYRTLKGHYGVETDASDVTELLAFGGSGGGGGAAHRGGSASTTTTKGSHKRVRDGPDGPTTSVRESELTAMRAGEVSGSPSAASAEDFAKQAEAYRLGQFRRQAQHIDKSTYSRTCFEFSKRGSCKRGASCAFLHVGSNGVVIPTAAPPPPGAPVAGRSGQGGQGSPAVVLPPRPR